MRAIALAALMLAAPVASQPQEAPPVIDLRNRRFDLRGELARLVGAEALDAAPQPAGDAMLAAFYLNELVLRLLPRNDPAPELFERYGELRSQLGDGPGLAWQLRRFERDLLELLGYGLSFGEGEDGEPIDPAARYLLDAERGALRDRSHAPGSTSGAALLALAQDRQPPPEQLQELRGALRGVLATHLGPTGLKSWGLLSELARLGRG